MQKTAKITVRLPLPLHERLKEVARATKRSLNKVIVDALWRGLEREEAEPLSEHERVMRVIRKSGLWEPMGPGWDKYIEGAPDMTVEEIREALRGLSPLSEDIIRDRGER
jgi:predicted DNA-binding protein